MSGSHRARVLDVGQCNPDHASIRSMISSQFDADIDRVMFVDEALAAMRRERYDLVLVNRLIFADGSEGIELVRRAREDPQLHDTPTMLVSNYPDAHAAAVAAGAHPGFGKAELFNRATADKLAAFLPRKETSSDRSVGSLRS